MYLINEKRFEKLFRRHYVVLCNYAGKYIPDREIVEDLVQNFFLIIWEKRSMPVSDEDFLRYAYVSIKNSCMNYYKSELVKQNFIERLSNELVWQNSDDDTDEFLYKEEIQRAMSKLPPKCREVLLLKCISELKYKEIAEIVGISVNTVKYHIGYAFQLIRKELKHLFSLFF